MDEKKLPQIKVSKNGPYLVSGSLPLQTEEIVSDDTGVSIEWRETKKYPEKANYSLCRCGKSKNKPFCDGSHTSCAFDGTEKPETLFHDQAERHEGAKLILYDAYDLCASARFCDRAGSIWSLIREDSEESKKIAIEEAANCSSGRLVVCDKADGKAIEPNLAPSISATEDPVAGVSGPLWVKGGVEIESADGFIYEKRNRITLCRCGKSKNMPFCDTSHIHEKFNDENICDQERATMDFNSFDRGVFVTNVLGVVLDEKSGNILIGRRENDPFMVDLTWCFPGGRPAYEEDIEHYLKVEILKKTNLEVDIKELIFAKTYPEDRRFLSIYYLCSASSGQEKTGEKFVEIKWIQPSKAKDYFTTSLHPKLHDYLSKLG